MSSTGKPVKIPFVNMGGGIVDGVPATDLQNHQSPYIRNLYPFGSRMKRRRGLTKVNTTAAPENIVSSFSFKENDGSYMLIVGMEGSIGKLDGGGVLPHTVAEGITLTSQAVPWQFKQYKDTLFACRPGEGSVRRGNTTSISNAGIGAPATAPTLADGGGSMTRPAAGPTGAEGGAGSIPAGDYELVYTFVNAAGDETNISPSSGAVTIGANKEIDWATIAVSTDSDVVARNLYRTKVDTPGTYYYLTQIADNTTVVYVDDILDGALGAAPPGDTGAILAGNYYGVVTYYNNRTGSESNPSDASVLLTAQGTRKIDWSGIPLAINPQVTSRRLYRTDLNQVGEYFLIATIDNNTDTTYAGDNVLTNDMGARVNFNSGLPTAIVKYMDLWNERLFVTDGDYVYYSEAGLPEQFGAVSALAIFPDDGNKVRGLMAFGEMMLVGKTNKMHFITGYAGRFSLRTLDEEHGLASGMSLASAEGQAFWYSGDNVMRTDGTDVQSISTFAIREILDAIPEDQQEKVVGVIYPRLGQYVLSVPSGAGAAANTLELVFNYKTNTWTVYEHAAPEPAALHLAEVFDDDYGKHVYAAFPGSLYLYDWNEGLTDDGTEMTASWRSKDILPEMLGERIGIRRIHLQATSTAGTLDISTRHPGESASFKSRSVTLNTAKRFKAYNFSTLQELAAAVSVQLDYTGTPHIEFDGLTVEAATFSRVGRAI